MSSILQTQTTSFKKQLYQGVHGGATTATSVSVTGTVAFVNFGNVSWTAALTARGALIYNSSKSDKAVAILDFGADKTSVTTFTVTMPANTSTTALIRLP